MNGKFTVKLDFVLQVFEQTDVTKFEFPLDDIIDSILNVTFLPRALSQNFTVIHSYE